MRHALRTNFLIIITLMLINTGASFAQQPVVNKGPLESTLPTNYIEPKRDPFRGEIIKPKTDDAPKQKLISELPPPSFEERDIDWRKQRAEALKRGQAAPQPAEKYLIDELQVIGVYQKPEGKGVFIKPKNVPGTTLFVMIGQKFYNGKLSNIDGKTLEFEQQTRLSNNTTKTEKRELRFSPK